MSTFEHMEDEKVRCTIIKELSEKDIEDKRREKEEMRKHGLVITIDGYEFILQGFTTVTDRITKDEIFHYKIKTNPNNKPEDNFVLYHLTPHPDSTKLLNVLRLLSERRGLPMMNIVGFCRHIVKVNKCIEQGKIKTEEGKHPNMKDYL